MHERTRRYGTQRVNKRKQRDCQPSITDIQGALTPLRARGNQLQYEQNSNECTEALAAADS